MKFFRFALVKIKLFVLFWTRIVFVRNNFNVGFLTKLKCNFGGGFLADQYILYDLKHNSKDEFLSEFDWYRSRYINAPFDFVFNNKVICTETLRDKIHVAENYYIKNKGIIYDFSNGRKTSDDIFNTLIEKKKLIIKPFALGKGNGVHLFFYDEGNVFFDDKRVDKDSIIDYLNKENGYIICEYIKQHSYAEKLFAKTANTIRLITLRDIENHEMKVVFAVQRIGTSSTVPVDNGSKGGLVSKINIETGVMSAAKCLKSTEVFVHHPDSGTRIEENVVPEWNEIKKSILKACSMLPYMDFIAWDILLTDDGPYIVEANSSSGVNILQLWGGQRKGELGDFFRAHKVIK